MSELRKIKRALISVSDKTGLAELATALTNFNVQIISTGGTAKFLRDNGFAVTDVSDVTGFPEMMDGRVKTLHPKIHGAFLALRDNTEHVASMTEHGIEPIDLVVVNLYPFEQTIAKDGVTLEEAVENIDIGGPAMIRSSAKNWRDVAVVTDPFLYDDIVNELRANDGSLSLETRGRLAAFAFSRTSTYDLVITAYLSRQLPPDEGDELWENVRSKAMDTATGHFPNRLGLHLNRVTDLRYGENPHQKAALYKTGEDGIANSEQLHGKALSFNNYVDAEAAWNLVQDFDELAVAIIKHTNPSGVGVGATNSEAYKRALSTDPVSAFGGIVAFNQKVDAEAAKAVIEVFSEVIIAPEFDDEAIEIFKTKKNLRVLRFSSPHVSKGSSNFEYKQISGGFLVQDADLHRLSINDLNIVTTRQPTDSEIKAMLFAWTACKHVKSNAIVFANEHQTLGVGAGQMNRVDSVRIAAVRAERFELPLKGAVLASDAFFPFRDNVDEAASFGVSAIIQPGGSIKDDESITAANEHSIAMAFTGIRHFKH
ncbi:MAG: bifunctional phosphoribosylaminoimidazolecarboxamide formyltransferase/IMP cyclohydrolase [Chloracidobacterium sp.]|nr:bifunctional phosphoribosylaminoimidazolecarboxamide formyltransferase/IMP cyclohydrolase [Chloracidobacterium sp.]